MDCPDCGQGPLIIKDIAIKDDGEVVATDIECKNCEYSWKV